MEITASKIVAIIAILISISATYNAYMLRGGKLALSQILMALGMISILLSLLISNAVFNQNIVGSFKVSDAFIILGFVLLFLASLRLRSSFELSK